MRKGFAISASLIMVLTACLVLIPSAAAEGDGLYDTPPVPIVNCYLPDYKPIGWLGSAFTIGIIVENPYDYNLMLIDILPPAYITYDPLEDLMWTVLPGHNVFTFVVILNSVEAESHWETNIVELYDHDGTLLASDEDDIWVEAYDGFTKTASLMWYEDGDEYIDLFEDVHWLFEITVANTDQWVWGGMYDIVITDRLAAELEIDEVVYVSQGTFSYSRKGNVKMTWEVGDLADGEEATLIIEISTKFKKKQQSYTSPGWYELNSGAALKFDRYIPCTVYIQHSAQTEQIWFEVPGYWPYDIIDMTL
jgi:hypothetical protein